MRRPARAPSLGAPLNSTLGNRGARVTIFGEDSTVSTIAEFQAAKPNELVCNAPKTYAQVRAEVCQGPRQFTATALSQFVGRRPPRPTGPDQHNRQLARHQREGGAGPVGGCWPGRSGRSADHAPSAASAPNRASSKTCAREVLVPNEQTVA